MLSMLLVSELVSQNFILLSEIAKEATTWDRPRPTSVLVDMFGDTNTSQENDTVDGMKPIKIGKNNMHIIYAFYFFESH